PFSPIRSDSVSSDNGDLGLGSALSGGAGSDGVVTMNFLQSYLKEIVAALKQREKKKETKRLEAARKREEQLKSEYQSKLDALRREMNDDWERRWEERERSIGGIAAV